MQFHYALSSLLCFVNSELNDATPVLAGHTIKGSDFQEKYLDRLFEVPQLICLFLQDRVSFEHINFISHTCTRVGTSKHVQANKPSTQPDVY